MSGIDFWLPALTVFAGNTLAFCFCSYKNDNSYIDVFWSLTFLTPIAALLSLNHNFNRRVILVTVLVTVWAVRLAWHIGARHVKEDFRYV